MKMNFKIIEIIRNPLDTVYSWYKRGLGSRYGNDPRVFTLLIKKNKKTLKLIKSFIKSLKAY